MKIVEKKIEVKFSDEERETFGEVHDILCVLIDSLKRKDLSRICISNQVSIDIDQLEDAKYIFDKLYDYMISWDAE